ncbi:MAG: BatA domain-containing protein [Cyclobacteriaceae bacterium]
MSFGSPYFLWALLCLAIPIIIHLFNFRKTIRVYFSNTKFLKQVQQETTQKQKLKQYLVLASRLLFLSFLVIAFAQPFLPASEQLSSQHNISIYLDNSLSMSAPIGEKTRALDEAIRMAQSIVDLFPNETRYQLITNDFAPYSNTFKTKAEMSDILSQVRLSAISRTSNEITNRVKEKGVTLFWISDFQKSTFGFDPALDSSLQVRLVPILLDEHSNIYVDSAYLENPFAIGGEKNTLKVILKNSGTKKIEGLVTKLSINKIQSGATSVPIEANGTTTISFDITSGLSGNNKASVSFSDYPVSFDNDFFLTLNFSSKLKVIEIKQGGPATYVEKVFGNKNLFSFQSFTISNLNYGLLSTADLVVVDGLNQIDASLAAAIKSYREKNGALLIIPGEQPEITAYQGLTGLPLIKNPSTEMSELNRPDFRSPLFANVFEEKNAAIAMPQATTLISWNDRSAVLQFKNNQPFLSQIGKTFLLACPLDKKFTDFQTNALFVPIMYHLASSGKKNEQPLYYSLTSSSVSIPSDSLLGEAPVKLVGAQEAIPSQRNFNGQLQLELPKYLLTAGFYNVIHSKDTLGLLAFNLNKDESKLEQLKPEEAKALLGGKPSISVFKSNNAESFNKEVKERYLGTPLWKHALILSLLFLLAEVLLIRFLK